MVPLLVSIKSSRDSSFPFIFKLSSILVSLHPDLESSNMIHADLANMDSKKLLSLFHYKKVVQINTNERRSWEKLLFLELELNMIDSLLLDSEMSIELFPTNPLFYYLNGLAYFYNKNYSKAIEPLTIGLNFIVSNPNLYSEVYSILGNCYNEMKNYDESDKAFDKSLENLPDNVHVLNNYAYYLSLRGVNLDKARQMSLASIEISPNEANYYDTYAWILFKMKNYKEAKIWMSKALDIEKSKTFFEHMADILDALGEYKNADMYRIMEIDTLENE